MPKTFLFTEEGITNTSYQTFVTVEELMMRDDKRNSCFSM